MSCSSAANDTILLPATLCPCHNTSVLSLSSSVYMVLAFVCYGDEWPFRLRSLGTLLTGRVQAAKGIPVQSLPAAATGGAVQYIHLSVARGVACKTWRCDPHHHKPSNGGVDVFSCSSPLPATSCSSAVTSNASFFSVVWMTLSWIR
jgi:hypothetical protein